MRLSVQKIWCSDSTQVKHALLSALVAAGSVLGPFDMRTSRRHAATVPICAPRCACCCAVGAVSMCDSSCDAEWERLTAETAAKELSQSALSATPNAPIDSYVQHLHPLKPIPSQCPAASLEFSTFERNLFRPVPSTASICRAAAKRQQ